MVSDNRPIGIFDSGLGGLTVAAALRDRLPGEDLIYLGDNARVPYGSKSKDTIIQFALEDTRFLVEREVKCVVIACNSVSSLAFVPLKEAFPDVVFINVVDAGVEAVLGLDDLARVLMIGTAATVNSDRYRMQIHRRSPQINVRSVACPMFVPLVEEGWVDGPIAEGAVHAYLDPELSANPDALILGCTHYPILKPLIQRLAPEETRIVDSAIACADSLCRYLEENGMNGSRDATGTERFFVTDMPASFFTLANRFFNRPVKHVERVSLS